MEPGIFLARGLAKLLVGGSVGRVMKQVVKNNVNTPANRREQIRLIVATYAISGMVADQASQWAVKELDQLVETVKKAKTKWDENKTEKPVETAVETTD